MLRRSCCTISYAYEGKKRSHQPDDTESHGYDTLFNRIESQYFTLFNRFSGSKSYFSKFGE